MKKQVFLKPFIRWAGGKQNVVKYLLQNTPAEEKINKYWEPFLGAGALFFANGFNTAELSDVNAHLINAYKHIRANPIDIYNQLLAHQKKLNEKYYYAIRQKYNEHISEKTIEQAVRFIFLVHTSFNGIYRVNQKGEYNVPIGKLSPSLPTLTHLQKVSKKLKGIKLAVRSYENILPLVQKNDFIYLDPPYPKVNSKDQFQQFTIDKFSEENQKELALFSNKLAENGCLVLISNSNVPLIKELYHNWNIIEIPVIRYISCKKEKVKVSELIIKNY